MFSLVIFTDLILLKSMNFKAMKERIKRRWDFQRGVVLSTSRVIFVHISLKLSFKASYFNNQRRKKKESMYSIKQSTLSFCE